MKYSNILETINDTNVIFPFPFKEWSEASNCILKKIYNPSDKYRSFDKGDIYFRTNDKSIRVQVFTGKKDGFYDSDHGAGQVTHYTDFVDINELIAYLHKNKYIDLLKTLSILIKNKTGISILN
jgi:hypothetical protein